MYRSINYQRQCAHTCSTQKNLHVPSLKSPLQRLRGGCRLPPPPSPSRAARRLFASARSRRRRASSRLRARSRLLATEVSERFRGPGAPRRRRRRRRRRRDTRAGVRSVVVVFALFEVPHQVRAVHARGDQRVHARLVHRRAARRRGKQVVVCPRAACSARVRVSLAAEPSSNRRTKKSAFVRVPDPPRVRARERRSALGVRSGPSR